MKSFIKFTPVLFCLLFSVGAMEPDSHSIKPINLDSSRESSNPETHINMQHLIEDVVNFDLETTPLLDSLPSENNVQDSLSETPLPIEIWSMIIGHIPKHHSKLSLVCKVFNLLSFKNNISYLLDRIKENSQGILEFKGRRLTINDIIQILSTFELLDRFHDKNPSSFPESIAEKRREIFNYIHTFRWSPLFKKANGPQRLQELANHHQVTLENCQAQTFIRSVLRDLIFAIPLAIVGLSGTDALLWVSTSYLPETVNQEINSQDFADRLSCIWDPVGMGGADCYRHFNNLRKCFTNCADYEGDLKIPLSSLNNITEFSEVLSPITQLIRENCRMTDPVGISQFTETSQQVFASFVQRGNNQDFVTRVMAANDRLHLFAGYWRSYIYDTYISAHQWTQLSHYDPSCIISERISSNPYVLYQVANTSALIAWVGFFLIINYIGWM